MPPDADKLRQRNKAAPTTLGEGSPASLSTSATNGGATEEERICSLSKLKTTEVAINGTIYDISDFDHPGGDQILMFGGNDVTIQYNMIHPYHTTKHFDKMKKVGTVADYTSE